MGKNAYLSNIIGTNLLTKFHEDRKKMWPLEKTALPTGGHVFQQTRTTFELNKDLTKNVTSRVFTYINETNVLTKFHDDWAKIVTSRVNTAPPPGGHVFQWTETIFELNQHIIKTNILTKLYKDWASNVTSTVFTSFKLSRSIIGTNRGLRAKREIKVFHEDRKINVASRVLTRKNALPPGSHVFQPTGIIF
ncbi:hypothetical protein DPMN_095632 [Dreissena polymorpha]|uniref:Uncharacterized protein n=1 Tax=Dreissena polymorpha TaxID=45954 RepID=A0A9D4R321_DREPO|nr:hypothetical protein DPMN_095632 [Dreissena polymorpha]